MNPVNKFLFATIPANQWFSIRGPRIYYKYERGFNNDNNKVEHVSSTWSKVFIRFPFPNSETVFSYSPRSARERRKFFIFLHFEFRIPSRNLFSLTFIRFYISFRISTFKKERKESSFFILFIFLFSPPSPYISPFSQFFPWKIRESGSYNIFGSIFGAISTFFPSTKYIKYFSLREWRGKREEVSNPDPFPCQSRALRPRTTPLTTRYPLFFGYYSRANSQPVQQRCFPLVHIHTRSRMRVPIIYEYTHRVHRAERDACGRIIFGGARRNYESVEQFLANILLPPLPNFSLAWETPFLFFPYGIHTYHVWIRSKYFPTMRK